MRCHTAKYKEWLEKEGEKEGMEIKVRFTKWDWRSFRKGNTIIISEEMFSPFFTEEERRAVGLHELAHIKYRHPERWRKEQQRIFQKCQIEADAYAKRRGFREALGSVLGKLKQSKKRWMKKGWYRIKWWMNPPPITDDVDERIERLRRDC